MCLNFDRFLQVKTERRHPGTSGRLHWKDDNTWEWSSGEEDEDGEDEDNQDLEQVQGNAKGDATVSSTASASTTKSNKSAETQDSEKTGDGVTEKKVLERCIFFIQSLEGKYRCEGIIKYLVRLIIPNFISMSKSGNRLPFF